MHTPAVQAVVTTFGVCAHWFPQAPQLAVSVPVSVSQPVFPVAQWVKPVSQAHWQAPATQEGVPLVDAQTVPHAPQFWGSVAVSVAQPLSPGHSA